MKNWFIITALRVTCCVFLTSVSTEGGEITRFRVDVENTWSEATHPGLVPHEAHFSWVAGASHRGDISFWSVGELASPAVVQMAETGRTTLFTEDLSLAKSQGHVFSIVDEQHWFCPGDAAIDDNKCGPTHFEFQATKDFPWVSFVTMLGPSPDWFVGVDRLDLRLDGKWRDSHVVDLHPYDGGTRSNNAFELYGPENEPPEPIQLITAESGQLITEQSLGTLTFTRLQDCDLDLNLECTADDIDLFNTRLASSTSTSDANGDGRFDDSDRALWLADAWGIVDGDVNLDGEVTFADFAAFSFYFGETDLGWAGGDFDGNGMTDFGDFLRLVHNYGDPVGARPAAVPEPFGYPILLAGLMVWVAAIRRRNGRL